MQESNFRVAILVDGFNLYHSLEAAIAEGAHNSIKWLNIYALCRSKLDMFNRKNILINKLCYFTSLANYRDVRVVNRHQAFIRALKITGFEIYFGEFKSKEVICEARCRQKYIAHVEKKTDVNIAVKLLELFHLDACDGCIILSGDADLISAVVTARRLFPKKKVAILSPYKRNNRSLTGVADCASMLDIEEYQNHRLSDQVFDSEGLTYVKIPKEWKRQQFSI